jgi:ABC-2 type transport system ATP-binding protein
MIGGPGAEAIAVRGLLKRYGARTVVDGLDLSVRRGEIFALLGPNGAGKTTTVEIIEGYRAADAGDVRVLGLDPWRDARALRPRVGLMLQNGGIYQYGRPRELIQLFAAFYRAPLDPDALLAEVGLREVAARPYRVLSGGERQRLALALALVGRPELVILDEPTSGMDPAARAGARELIAGLRRSGVTVLMTTHDLTDVEALADRVAILVGGRIVAEGPPMSIAGIAGADLTASFGRGLGGDEIADVIRVMTSAILETPTRLRIPGGANDPSLVAALAAWSAAHDIPVVEIRSGQTLEERYLGLVAAAGLRDPGDGPGPSAAR